MLSHWTFSPNLLRPGSIMTRKHGNIANICKGFFQLYLATLLNLYRIPTQGEPISRFDTVSPSDWREWWVGLESKQNKALHDTLTTQMSRARDVVLRPFNDDSHCSVVSECGKLDAKDGIRAFRRTRSMLSVNVLIIASHDPSIATHWLLPLRCFSF